MKKYVALMLAMLTLLTILAGCGGNASGGDGAGPVPDSGSGEAKTSITLRDAANMTTTNPADTNIANDYLVHEQIYEGLYDLDEANGGYTQRLAKDVQISDDGLTYTVTLQDAVFHNGEKLTANDVAFSYQWYMDHPKYNSYTNMIDHVDVVDETTANIVLKSPYSPILHSFHKIKILSEKEVTGQGSKFGTIANLAGTGPYMWDESRFNSNSGWTLVANENYWRGAPAIKTIDYVVIEDDTAAVIALQNGEIDYMPVPLANWEEIKGTGKFDTMEIESNDLFTLCINWESSDVLDNDLVREAILCAVDRDAINMIVCEGMGTPTHTYINPNYAEAAPTEVANPVEYNPERARELLAQAGYPNGVDVGEFIVAAGRNEQYATVIQANLEEVGITAHLTPLEYAVAADRGAAQEYNLFIAYDCGNYDFNNFRQQAHSECVGMYQVHFGGKYADLQKHFDELLEEGAILTDEDERIEVYTELYNLYYDTHTQVPLVVPPACIAWNKNLNAVPVPSCIRVYDWSWK